MSDERIDSRVARGAAVSIARTVIAYAVGATAAVVLAKSLSPAAVGAGAALSALHVIIVQVCALGLAQAIVRARAPVDTIRAAFWALQAAYSVLATVIIGVVAAGLLSGVNAFLAVSLAAYLLVQAWRFPLWISANRDVALGRLATVETLDVLVFQGGAAVLAVAGFGVSSYGYALIAAGLTAAVCSAWMARFHPGTPHLRGLRAVARDAGRLSLATTLTLTRELAAVPVIAVALGATAAGLLSWASSLAAFLVVGSVAASQSLFAGVAAARASDDAPGATFAVRLIALGVCGAAGMLAAAAPALTSLLATDAWASAQEPMVLMLVAAVAVSLCAPLLQVAYARGRAHRAARWQLWAIVVAFAGGLPIAVVTKLEMFCCAIAAGSVIMLTLAWRDGRAHGTLAQGTFAVVIRCAAAAIVAAIVGRAALTGGAMAGTMSAAVTAAVVYVATATALGARRRAVDDLRALAVLLRG